MPGAITVPAKGHCGREPGGPVGMFRCQPAGSDDISSYLTLLVHPALTMRMSDDTLVLPRLQITLNLLLPFVWAPCHMFRFALVHAASTSKKTHAAAYGLSPAHPRDSALRSRDAESATRFPTWRGVPPSGDASLHQISNYRSSILTIGNFDIPLHWFSSVVVPRSACRAESSTSFDRTACSQEICVSRGGEIYK
jgi:hypothetical protein